MKKKLQAALKAKVDKSVAFLDQFIWIILSKVQVFSEALTSEAFGEHGNHFEASFGDIFSVHRHQHCELVSKYTSAKLRLCTLLHTSLSITQGRAANTHRLALIQ